VKWKVEPSLDSDRAGTVRRPGEENRDGWKAGRPWGRSAGAGLAVFEHEPSCRQPRSGRSTTSSRRRTVRSWPGSRWMSAHSSPCGTSGSSRSGGLKTLRTLRRHASGPITN